jgi:hypothetical protein
MDLDGCEIPDPRDLPGVRNEDLLRMYAGCERIGTGCCDGSGRCDVSPRLGAETRLLLEGGGFARAADLRPGDVLWARDGPAPVIGVRLERMRLVSVGGEEVLGVHVSDADGNIECEEYTGDAVLLQLDREVDLYTPRRRLRLRRTRGERSVNGVVV